MTQSSKRQAIFDKTGGRCYYCGDPLPAKGWHKDHVVALRRNFDLTGRMDGSSLNPEAEREDNFVPACASCNLQKGPLTVEQFRDKIQGFVNSLNAYHNQYIVAKRYGLVEETGKKITFWFEREASKP
jgi:5-methylcytosine-specific restriction endonuclease McrA